MRTINSFHQVEEEITHKSLVILDIDDTVLTHPGITREWFDNRCLDYLNQGYPEDQAYTLAIRDWTNAVNSTTPVMTDEKGLKSLYTKCLQTDSNIIFLTARDPKLKEFTEAQLDMYNIRFGPIYHSEQKGEFIRRYLSLVNYYHNVIFIDDQDYNLADVGTKNNHVKLFKFVVVHPSTSCLI